MKEAGTVGTLGETAAADFLIRNGYSVLDRNFRTRFGEIDVIARNSKYLVFAEVKTRKKSSLAVGREYVDYRKQARLIKTAQFWLASNQTELQPRFDVIEINYSGNFDTLEINHIENAFDVS